MKNKVNVVKKIAFLKGSRPWAALFAVVVLASLVVLSGCQGAVGPTGDAGKAGKDGVTGPAGPAGPAGTSDNEQPVLSNVIPTQYLVVKGGATPAATVKPTATAAAGNYGSVEIDLDEYFTDTRAPALTYKAMSSNTTIAKVDTSATDLVTGKLKITAKGVGTSATATNATATITVYAYDGVTDPVETTFNVVVVASNSPPSVTGVDPIEDLIGENKLYMTAGTITRTFKATIDPGSIGTAKDTPPKFRVIVGSVATTDDVVRVTDPVSAGINTYSVSITALIPPSVLGTPTPVKIFARDSFEAEMEVTAFAVTVNTPPEIFTDLPNVNLYRTGDKSKENEAQSWRADSNVANIYYQLDNYFDNLELSSVDKDGSTKGTVTGDTTCTFSTSPTRQPTGRKVGVGVTADPITAITLASVTNGATSGLLTALIDTTTNSVVKTWAKVVVNSAASKAAAVGNFTLTITCADLDARVSNSARIRVRE